MSDAGRILIGDARAVLPTLAAGSVHCCVTSPPYYGLRDYGVDGQIGLEPTLNEYISTARPACDNRVAFAASGS